MHFPASKELKAWMTTTTTMTIAMYTSTFLRRAHKEEIFLIIAEFRAQNNGLKLQEAQLWLDNSLLEEYNNRASYLEKWSGTGGIQKKDNPLSDLC